MSALLTFQDSTASASVDFAQHYVRCGPSCATICKTGQRGHRWTGDYDDRDGKIWMDGKLVDWRDANVHLLTHAHALRLARCSRASAAMAARSSRAPTIPSGCWPVGAAIDMPIPWTVDEIEAAKAEVLAANGLTDAYVRAVAWRGAGPDMGVSARATRSGWPSPRWEWGAYYGDAKTKRRQARHRQVEAPRARDDPVPRQGRRPLHDLHHVQARGRGQGLLGRDDVRLSRLRGRGDGRQHLLRQGRRGAHAPARLLPQRHHPADRHRHAEGPPDQGARAPHRCPTSWKASSSAG